MRLTQILNRQHIGFMFKKHWVVQGKRVPLDTGIEAELREKGIPIEDALEFVKEKPQQHERLKIVGFYDPPLPLDENHPEYKERPCYTISTNNVLLEGLSQAQVLTKTVIAEDRLPQKIEELASRETPKEIHVGVKKAILSANVFDCEQKKLPKIKDPVRPAYNFPRILGITDRRKNIILTNKLLQLIEKTSNTDTPKGRYVINDAESKAVFEKNNELFQFLEVSHILVTSKKPLKHDVSEKDIPFVHIPDLYPVRHTVTMNPVHFYSEDSKYPIRPSVSVKHPHTTWLHYNHTEVANLFETPVTNEQLLGRSLTHAFGVATAYAKQLHGDNVQDLPEPVYINCIQTDGQKYHFGVLELNTLNLDGTEGTKNVWYCKNNVTLYDSSRYFNGMPVLENYNPEVYGYINAFYNC
ncbi:hypothetical protein JYU34_018707 [Plutella xylostella]|uniref:39S ribosomal protein L37, mitochondrial n=1 Tax=Plutella xylostella TaxID=51655 RepID=A0ABQ7Q234_PLUXY|nr:hypothetical protein JYU34_018707 [Plutella xylostella]